MKKIIIAFIAFAGILTATAQEVKMSTSASEVKWVGKKATGQHNGTINLTEAKFIMNGDQLTGGSFTIDMKSIDCKDLPGAAATKLENHLKSADFFGVEKYPTATYVITKVSSLGNGSFNVTGNMTIKEITKEISFVAKVKKEQGKVTATADFQVDRSEFNVRYGSGSFFDNLGDGLIYDDFDLSISLVSQ